MNNNTYNNADAWVLAQNAADIEIGYFVTCTRCGCDADDRITGCRCPNQRRRVVLYTGVDEQGYLLVAYGDVTPHRIHRDQLAQLRAYVAWLQDAWADAFQREWG